MIGVKRNPTPPASLAKKKSYKAQDVLEQLEADFHGKCYLCERDVGSDFQVDHLRPILSEPGLQSER
jgi:hypothetical protein